MTELTREQVAALLDGIGAGVPEEKFDEELGSMVLTSEGVNMICARMDLYRAAPDLARQLLAAMDRLADADMAQAALLERAAEEAKAYAQKMLNAPAYHYDSDVTGKPEPIEFYEMLEIEVADALCLGIVGLENGDWPRCSYDRNDLMRETALAAVSNALQPLEAAIRTLAPDAGVKAVAELRAERDRLAADNANLQARIEKLREAMNNAAMYLASGFINCHRCGEEVLTSHTDAEHELRTALAEDDILVSALATREAWKGILPGGEG